MVNETLEPPLFEELNLNEEDAYLIAPFFTNLDKSVFAVTILPPEVIGALCSRTSRAKGDLRQIFLKEFIKPFLETKTAYGDTLREFIDFLHKNPISVIFSNPKGREFYVKWLAQYGDDSIAQMTGLHLAYTSLSLVAIKHFEHMRIGIAPIEKSTRYVDYSEKINGKYRYYVDPALNLLGLNDEYVSSMDHLFDTYSKLLKSYGEQLRKQHPDESEVVIKTKTFDTIRGILPLSTLSQVAFFANGQAFEYAINRSIKHPLTEIRWAANAGYQELNEVAPALFHRVEGDVAQEYQNHLSTRSNRLIDSLNQLNYDQTPVKSSRGVRLIDFDPDGENKVIASLIYPEIHTPYEALLDQVRKMSVDDKKSLLDSVFVDRKARWYKVPRAFEHAQVTFEVTANWGVWKDLQRHRMMTQFNENFSVYNGFETPPELVDTGLGDMFNEAIERASNLAFKIEAVNPLLAQYCVTQAHYVRFIQHQNLRSFFWEAELRTIAQGHPDYRKIEQEKIMLLKPVYPILMDYLIADMNDYHFARRGTDTIIKSKEESLKKHLEK